MPNIFFLLVVILVLSTLHGYVILRILPAFGLSNNSSWFLFVLICFFSALPILPPILRMIGYENKLIDRFLKTLLRLCRNKTVITMQAYLRVDRKTTTLSTLTVQLSPLPR